MKGKLKQNRKKKKGNEVLEKYMLAVDEFVKSKSGTEEAENDHGLRFVKKKSRKELRKEKRKMKKARMKSHYEGKKTPTLPDSDGGTSGISSEKQKNKNTEKVNNVSKTQSSGGPTAKPSSSKTPMNSKKGKKIDKLQESRKMALIEANQQEDREIKKLERCLGLNKRKNKKSLPQSFVADGLDYILGVLDSGSSATGVYDDDDDIDMAKENFEKLDENDSQLSEDNEELGDDRASEGSTEDIGSVEVDDDDDDEMNEGDDDDDDDDETNDEEEEEQMDDELDDSDATGSDNENEGETEEVDTSHIKTSDTKSESVPSPTDKYVPPHLRNAGDQKRKAELEKLKRNVKGMVNRLSEPSMASISSQLEELYMSCSRKDMNETLTEVLLAACVTPTLMPDRLLMEHILLVSVLHHTIGLEVGANFLETVVRKFDELYKKPGDGKECDNLAAIIAHLYNFQVVHSSLIFDILKLLVGAFTEKDIELVLFVLRNVGFALRKDDALTLKELISEAQQKANDLGSRFQDQTRVRFMLETMLALKNNDMRKIPGYNPETVERLRKLQRTLIHHRAGGSDMKLRVSLNNLLAAEQVGRWWIVGSSWSGTPMISEQGSTTTKQSTVEGQFSAKVLELARKQRMNTEVRQNIFCVIMTSEDYLDAFEKLLRMGLKDKQEREIVHVLMDCCLQEKAFNAFYAVLGEKICSHDRRFQMTFQFSLWDKFKELSNLPNSNFNNLVQLVTHFLQRKCLSLSILKVIEFGELDKPKVRFLRQVLTKLLKETEPDDLAGIFGRISGIPKLGMLREGLKLFISHFLLKNAQSQGPAEQAAKLLEHAQVATRAMEAKEAKLKL
ncbi:nucleolar MIF4G domain-containing protein 1 [Mastacembelus armatus]|uniref:Nucleolar MIF4G domain-containing protein 1 n=1 Tax=Mastacembelus armatus TaxID=205130 RepID=A0A3Q3KXJ5_9TELE|nr:nucleolar MIF4G domain-containing protein 1 [Mastacembelus armatus]XP_026148324.1 nucleolar MIF4G domain-containing protein 1 [Mastacembelus armatus]